MQVKDFMQIYSDLVTRNKITAESHFYFHVNLLKGQGLARLKVPMKTVAFLSDSNGEPAGIVRFIPVGEGMSGMDFKQGCEVYMPIEQIICISDDQRAEGYRYEDIFKNNDALISAFTEKQAALMEGDFEKFQKTNTENIASSTASDDSDDSDTSDSDTNTGSADGSGNSGGLGLKNEQSEQESENTDEPGIEPEEDPFEAADKQTVAPADSETDNDDFPDDEPEDEEPDDDFDDEEGPDYESYDEPEGDV